MKKNTEAKNYIWNSVGGMLNAGQSVFLLIVITRALGLEAAGIFSIAFATGNLFMYFGNYGVRNYQVSDLSQKCSFEEYLFHRVVTVFLMLAGAAVFTGESYFFGGYSVSKAAAVMLMCILKAVDCLEEVFEGRLQQKGRLDLAGKLMTFRLVVSIGGMMAVLYILKDLNKAVLAAVVLAVVSAGAMILLYKEVLAFGEKDGSHIRFAAVKGLFVSCFPVCAANFLSFYMVNSPKYAIDAAMSEAAQARYNFIAMPVFVIQLLNMFMYQPVLVRMTRDWNAGNRKAFLSSFYRILAGLLVIALACLAGAYVLGVPVLSALYATDLSDLKAELMLILVGGVFLAMNGFYSAVLTIERMQNKIPLAYLAGTVLALLITVNMTRTMGIMGAVLAFLAAMVLACLILTGLFINALRKS